MACANPGGSSPLSERALIRCANRRQRLVHYKLSLEPHVLIEQIASGFVLDQPFYQPIDLAGFFHVRQVSGLLEDVNGNA